MSLLMTIILMKFLIHSLQLSPSANACNKLQKLVQKLLTMTYKPIIHSDSVLHKIMITNSNDLQVNN